MLTQRALLDVLSSRNCKNGFKNLLRLEPLERSKKFIDLSYINADEILEKIVVNQSTCTLKNNETEESGIVFQKLKELKNIINTEEKKKGKCVLNIGYIFVEGWLDKKRRVYVRAPLFLIPVTLEKLDKKKTEYVLKYNKDKNVDTDIEINMILLKEIKKYKDMDLSNLNDFKIDRLDEETIKNVLELLKHEWDFESECIEVVQGDFVKVTSREISEEKLKLKRYMILSLINHGKAAIYRDYQEFFSLIDKGIKFPILVDLLEDNLIEKEYERPQEVEKIPEGEKFYITDLDISQEEAVQSALNNKMTVIQGPPGTGKSQVIASIISSSIAEGKKVLMVSEKDAALAVIYNELMSVRLSQFVAKVSTIDAMHSFYSEILRERIHHREKHQSPCIELEKANIAITEVINELDEIHRQLYKKDKGICLREIYQEPKILSTHVPEIDIDVVARSITLQTVKEKEKDIKAIANMYWIHGDNEYFEGIHHHENIDSEIIARLLNNIKRYLNKDYKSEVVQFCHKIDNQEKINSMLACMTGSAVGINKWKRWWFVFKNKKSLEIVFSKEELLGDPNDKVQQIDKIQKEYFSYKREVDKLGEYLDKSILEELKIGLMGREEALHKIDRLGEVLQSEELQRSKQAFKRVRPEVVKALKENVKTPLDRMTLEESWIGVLHDYTLQQWREYLESEFPRAKLASNEDEEYKEVVKNLKSEMQKKKGLIPLVIAERLENQADKIRLNIEKSIHTYTSRGKSKRSRKPIRQFVNENLENGLLDYLPIWLVTPAVCSSIFPNKEKMFDVVIFDEASQITVDDALPALFRGKSYVIAGDTKQLPPPNFKVEEEEEFDNITKDLNISLLTDAQSLLHFVEMQYYRCTIQLNYHYRSKYAELINFSNYAFYKGSIFIAPSPSKENSPIEWIKVDNVTKEDEGNREEAEVLIEKLSEYLKGEESIGIIAFTQKQKEMINKCIQKRCEEDSEFTVSYSQHGDREDSPIFIASIDEIQGDQRDVIFFSVGYAADKDGVFSGTTTGKLNKAEGPYRLNVAITRAKNKVIMVSSIEPSSLECVDKDSGRYYCCQYMKYAKAISNRQYEVARSILQGFNQTNTSVVGENKTESPLEEQIIDKLQEKNIRVVCQYGVSGFRLDFAVIHPKNANRFILAIEADGAAFHSSKSAKERDVYRQNLLEKKGWKFIRIWSRDWWKNPNKEIKRIENRIEEILKEEVDD